MSAIPEGLVWLHVVGPEGTETLLASYSSRKRAVTLIDENNTSYPVVGNKVHVWTIFAVEPVHRPDPPAPRGYVLRPSNEFGPSNNTVTRTDEGIWVDWKGPLNPGTQVFSDASLRKLIFTT